jgi:hypothetical protein
MKFRRRKTTVPLDWTYPPDGLDLHNGAHKCSTTLWRSIHRHATRTDYNGDEDLRKFVEDRE